MTDQEILDGLKSGASSAVEYILIQWKARTVSVLTKDDASLEDASEILREVIYAIMLRLQDRPLELSKSFEAYLTRACRYAWWRKKKRTAQMGTLPEDIALEDDPSLEELMVIQERNALLWESVDQLSPECRSIIYGVYQQGKTLRSIGDKMEYSRNFINKKPRRCFKALLKIWSTDPRYKDYFLR